MIDVLLHEQGWDVSDRSRVWMEVDTKQSDFAKKIYKTVSETLKNDLRVNTSITCYWTVSVHRLPLSKQSELQRILTWAETGRDVC